MRAIVTGAGGQVGRALLATVPPGIEAMGYRHGVLDITDGAKVDELIGVVQPDVVINAAAYTSVDRAEHEHAAAYAVNADAPAHLARAVHRHGCRLLHISTDFVFDGTQARPYRPDDPTAPLGIYGSSKLEGERRVREVLGEAAIIIRTAWVYAAEGSNFLRTMLRLMQERDEVRVVNDQTGTPTWAVSLAETLWAAVLRQPVLGGIYHWTDAGSTTWHGFAVAIQEEALKRGLLARAVPVRPITTLEYPTPARRPAYSVLDCSSLERALSRPQTDWRVNLHRAFGEVRHA